MCGAQIISIEGTLHASISIFRCRTHQVVGAVGAETWSQELGPRGGKVAFEGWETM